MHQPPLDAVHTAWICGRATALGFALCGVAPAAKFPELERYPEWLERGYAGEMDYLSDPRRLNPQDVLNGIDSLVVCALNYNAPRPYSTEAPSSRAAADPPRGCISRYAWGDDYHEVLWGKLNTLAAELKNRFGDHFAARAYADTGPIHERLAAKYAGLGWVGKNTLLLNQSAGSWLFLGVILTTLPLAPSLAPHEAPPPDRCGSCRACIDACPTQAIVEPYVLDASRCLAYLTIELRSPIPEVLRESIGHHVFGCDICQDVCPWNRKSPRTVEPAFQPRQSLFGPDLLWLANLSEQQFREIFRGSPVKRAKWRGLVRNACIALGNTAGSAGPATLARARDTLTRLSASSDPLISESAQLALSRIQSPDDQPASVPPSAG